jgi:hypothetical protein
MGADPQSHLERLNFLEIEGKRIGERDWREAAAKIVELTSQLESGQRRRRPVPAEVWPGLSLDLAHIQSIELTRDRDVAGCQVRGGVVIQCGSGIQFFREGLTRQDYDRIRDAWFDCARIIASGEQIG